MAVLIKQDHCIQLLVISPPSSGCCCSYIINVVNVQLLYCGSTHQARPIHLAFSYLTTFQGHNSVKYLQKLIDAYLSKSLHPAKFKFCMVIKHGDDHAFFARFDCFKGDNCIIMLCQKICFRYYFVEDHFGKSWNLCAGKTAAELCLFIYFILLLANTERDAQFANTIIISLPLVQQSSVQCYAVLILISV